MTSSPPTSGRHTGLLPDAYFSATKTQVDPGPRGGGQGAGPSGGAALRNGGLLAACGSSPAAAVHVTDYTNASRTMLFDIQRLCWDEHICRTLDIPMEMLPQVRDSSAVYGTAEPPGSGGPYRRHRR